jgi:uncharacterized lipoprotein YmbA
MRRATLLLAGCALTSKAPPRELRYFEPELPAHPRLATAPCARIRLSRVDASAALRLSIERRLSPVELQPYETLRWTELPDVYAERALAAALFETHPLEQAITGPVDTLAVTVSAFEEIPGAARVELRFELRDERRVLDRGVFRVERAAAKPTIEAVVAATGAALGAASDQLADRVVADVCR